jgi:hypothetical protein
MPSTQVQLRRGTTEEHSSFIGAVGEVTVDTSKRTLRVHDGVSTYGQELIASHAVQTLTNKTLTTPAVDKILSSTQAVTVGTSPAVVDSFSATTYRGAKYIITIENATNYSITEALVVHNGTTAYVSVYGDVVTNSDLGDFSCSLTDSTVNLMFTGTASGNSVKIFATYIII